ncbi:hypothetical protein D8Y22_06810 [Salinadaptatus halalkaliphilus]|uniref:Uncharacterized protein n=1 Tax=Salinadaptatus halalkaliphilus TaxID=2419781 RepID=A0A4V3VLH7_9EURY|nr:DHHC zinc finger domain-containing protein [Salinadaptatus halalkaliphilus]THE65637.1 hypothetical protein D8Y22_06810 [Salinadaptatus halalkaliphilus]
MTTSATSSDGLGLFDSTFSIVSTIGAVLLVVIGVVSLWTGYQGSTLPVIGTELTIITGIVGFMFAVFFAIGAFIMAAFMEPGFDR